MFITRAMCGLTYALVAVLCKYLERWSAAFNEGGLSVCVLMHGPTLTSVELHTFHF
jgi:hypothetical protein